MELIFPECVYKALDKVPSLYLWVDSGSFAYGVPLG